MSVLDLAESVLSRDETDIIEESFEAVYMDHGHRYKNGTDVLNGILDYFRSTYRILFRMKILADDPESDLYCRALLRIDRIGLYLANLSRNDLYTEWLMYAYGDEGSDED